MANRSATENMITYLTSSLSGYLDSQGENPVDEGGRETGAEVGHHPVEVRRVHHTRLQQGRYATLGVLAYTNGCVWLMDSQLKIIIFFNLMEELLIDPLPNKK